MRILILSFYYPPDLSAGSFRVKALEGALRNNANENLHIDILTTMPNRYSSHVSEAAETETSQGLSIRRIQLPSHNSGMVDQAKAFAVFARGVMRETQGQEWDLVVATSSRLMTAALGAHIATRAKTFLYLDIRDLFTDTMQNLLAKKHTRHLLPGFRWLEKRTFNKADRINLVSPGFLPYAKEIAPLQDYRLFTNGIDEEFLKTNFLKQPSNSADSIPLVVYAGNMGEGQGLHKVLPQAARLLTDKAQFRLLGDGGRRAQLEGMIADTNVSNIEIFSPVPRTELYTHYRDADVLFLHLNDYAAFHKVLPSKIFEYAATGKPILAGVAGYAAEFLKSEVEGVQIFAPCDAKGMVHALDNLLSDAPQFDRKAFKEKFPRTQIIREMARDILQLASR